MENTMRDWEMTNLVRELSEGREQARQLQIHLNTKTPSSSSTSSYETQEYLLHRIISSYDHALAMLQVQPHNPPPSVDSPHTDDSDQDNQSSRKRKGTPRWTQRVKVSPETGIEGQLDDGYGWRKYGQKDILGAKHPRGYYRCTNRHGQGCLATKHVQKSDEDPTVFVITYRREHTCNPRAPITNNPPPPQDPLFDIQTSLKIITTTATQQQQQQDPLNFTTPPTIINTPIAQTNDNNNNIFGNNNNNYFLLDNDFGALIPNLMHSSESELSTIAAAMTSGTTSTAVGTTTSFTSGMDTNFTFGDHHGYYRP